MKTLEMCQAFWREVGLPLFQRALPQIVECAAAGLAIDSAAIGWDDDLSRDHDWGPRFDLFVPEASLAENGELIRNVLRRLPREFRGTRTVPCRSFSFEGQFDHVFGEPIPPREPRGWFRVPEFGLFDATKVTFFHDPSGEGRKRKESFPSHYPDPVMNLRLAACCYSVSQSRGHMERMINRGFQTGAIVPLGVWVHNVHLICFQLNRRFAPFYKWIPRLLPELKVLVPEIISHLDAIQRLSWLERLDICQEVEGVIGMCLRKRGVVQYPLDVDIRDAFPVPENLIHYALQMHRQARGLGLGAEELPVWEFHPYPNLQG
jgi:hypothetical protein